jgi:hypothetical protein
VGRGFNFAIISIYVEKGSGKEILEGKGKKEGNDGFPERCLQYGGKFCRILKRGGKESGGRQ